MIPRVWLRAVQQKLSLSFAVETCPRLYILPKCPYVESFNSRMRDELLDGKIFLTLAETKYVVDQ
jgi:hypothetical protein